MCISKYSISLIFRACGVIKQIDWSVYSVLVLKFLKLLKLLTLGLMAINCFCNN